VIHGSAFKLEKTVNHRSETVLPYVLHKIGNRFALKACCYLMNNISW
jgi:hypothetical protein